MPRTVLIVDDHAGFRSTARQFLECEGFEVVGEAEDGASGIRAARELHPDVVLLDVQLPDLDGFAVAERIRGEDGAPQVILTSTRDRSEYGSLIDASAACGFVCKGELSGAAIEALLDKGSCG